KVVLDRRPVAAALPGQACFALGIVKICERAQEQSLIDLLVVYAADRVQTLGDAEPMLLQGDVEVEEIAARAAIEDRVKFGAKDPGDVEMTIGHVGFEKRQHEDRDI